MSFLTVLGRATAAQPTSRTLSWFPFVGALVGALVGVTWWAAGKLWPPAVAAILAVALDAGVTGGLHLDGLADAADGLLPPVERGRRLEIMADPRVGAFGVVALVLVLALRIAGLAVVRAVPLVVTGLWCASRTLMAVGALVLPYARADGGVASAFLNDPATARGKDSGGRVPWVLVASSGLALAFVCVVAGSGVRGAITLAAEAATMVGVGWLALRRLGGYTGDVLGAAGVLGETVGLLVLAAR